MPYGNLPAFKNEGQMQQGADKPNSVNLTVQPVLQLLPC
jgi:hypothetical protein